MSSGAMPMDFEEIPQQPPPPQAPHEGTLTQSPFAHVNTGVYSGHPGLQAFLTLGVPPNAPLSAIKSAYRELARAYHPDKANADDQLEATKRFSEISAAYELLMHAYDMYDGKGSNQEKYPVFFATPESLEAHTPNERDPYHLYRSSQQINGSTSNAVNLPSTAPGHCIIPGDSTSLFQTSASNSVPLCLPYEAQPPPLVAHQAGEAMEVEGVPNMKRTLEDDNNGYLENDLSQRKRQRRMEPTETSNGNDPSMIHGNGHKRDAPSTDFDMDYGNPAAKKPRTV